MLKKEDCDDCNDDDNVSDSLPLMCFFRNADAVVVMYDVCNESSFLNVLDWISSVKVSLCINIDFFNY